MANATEFNTAGFAQSAIANLRTAVAGLVQTTRTKLHQRRVYLNTLNELDSLSVRELNDLGLNRATLRTVAHEAAYGKA